MKQTDAPIIHTRLVSTTLGEVGLAWSDQGLLALQLPESTERKTRLLTEKRVRDLGFVKPQWVTKGPASIERLAKKLQQHFLGKSQDFSETPLALGNLSSFSGDVYRFCLEQLPAGKTMTYGELAAAIGKPKSARAVGMAMSKNPVPIVVPCHRVLSSSRKDQLCGFSAPGGIQTKQKLLALEGVQLQ